MAKVQAATGPIMEMIGMAAGSAALLVGVRWVRGADMQASRLFALLVTLGDTAETYRTSSPGRDGGQGAKAAGEGVVGVSYLCHLGSGRGGSIRCLE